MALFVRSQTYHPNHLTTYKMVGMYYVWRSQSEPSYIQWIMAVDQLQEFAILVKPTAGLDIWVGLSQKIKYK